MIAPSSYNRILQIAYDESPIYVHLISGVAALNNKPNLKGRIRIYLVTFFPPVSSIKCHSIQLNIDRVNFK